VISEEEGLGDLTGKLPFPELVYNCSGS